MKPWDRLKYLKGNLAEVVKKMVRTEADVGRFRLERHFYQARVEIIQDNLETLRSGNYVVSMTEYKLIMRDYYYNRGHYCEALVDLMRVENELETLKAQCIRIEAEMDDLIKEIENSVVVLPFKRPNEQE